MHNISFNLRIMTICSNPVGSLFSLPRCDPIILTRTQLIPFLCQGNDSDNGTADSPWGGWLDYCRLLFQWHATIKRSMQQLHKKKFPMERVSLILITWGLQINRRRGGTSTPPLMQLEIETTEAFAFLWVEFLQLKVPLFACQLCLLSPFFVSADNFLVLIG